MIVDAVVDWDDYDDDDDVGYQLFEQIVHTMMMDWIQSIKLDSL